MLKQASLEQLSSGALTRADGHIVVCMRYYPRFLKKELRDEYLCVLSPDEKLFGEFKAMQKKLADHNVAFRLVKYEERFGLSAEGLVELERLCRLACEKDVYLVCQCGVGVRCHRDLLLLVAGFRFGVPLGVVVERPRIGYLVFEGRLRGGGVWGHV